MRIWIRPVKPYFPPQGVELLSPPRKYLIFRFLAVAMGTKWVLFCFSGDEVVDPKFKCSLEKF